jgi:hypothetical protein
MIPIFESYQRFQPPSWVRPTVAKLLAGIPDKYVAGLGSIVLTNASAIGKGKTQRFGGRKYARADCLGFYHCKRRDEQAWIEIVVDNVVYTWFRPRSTSVLSVIPLAREIAFSDVLFHEVGHHLDHVLGAPAPSGEAAAEAWKKILQRSYLAKRRSLRFLLRIVRRFRRGGKKSSSPAR